ncbi:hypothetical protein Tco_0429950, partial [Tanacetum coccineum]
FETDESAATPPPPRSPQTVIPLSKTRICRARISVRPHTPPSPSTKVRITEYAAVPTPSSPPPSPLSPQTIIPLSHTGLCKARKTVRPQIPLSSFIKTHIVEYAIAPTPSSPPPSSLSPLSSPLPLIPSPPLLLPSLTRGDIIPKAD